MIAPVAAIPPQLRVRLPARDLREALDGPFAQAPYRSRRDGAAMPEQSCGTPKGRLVGRADQPVR